MTVENECPSNWVKCIYEDLLDYIQPTKYIVESTDYNDTYKTPVLTAGKSFIKGYTDEKHGVFDQLPTIIFDDFTTASRYVTFPFKVKSSAMKILVPSSQLVNLKFVDYCMQSDKIRCDTHKRYWISVYAKKDLLLPPLNEQHRIVAKIEELFSELEKGVESLKTAREQLKVYRQSVLKAAFEGRLTESWRQEHSKELESATELLACIKAEREARFEAQLTEWQQAVETWEAEGGKASGIKKPTKPKKLKELPPLTTDELAILPEPPRGWAWVKVDTVSGDNRFAIKAGPFGSALKKEFYVPSGYKIYGQEQVISGDAKFGDYFVSEEKYQELISCAIKPQDILISLVGTVGKVLILPADAQAGIINPRLIKISPNLGYYSPVFFKYYFESAFLKGLYKTETHGATMDVLNLGIIQSLPFPLCSMDEQHQIVQEIESRFSVVEKMEQTIDESLQKAEALRQSILKRAFEGKLVPQNPDDEPASELLARIRRARRQAGAEREAVTSVGRGRKVRNAL